MKRIYFAGPDVFKPNYEEIKNSLKSLALDLGFVGVFPADGDPFPPGTENLSLAIYEQNIALINSADIVMANVENFRGNEPDSGTVFEIGYAKGCGKEVWCYNAPKQPLIDQIAMGKVDGNGYTIEDFGHPRNLMLMHAGHVISDPADVCLQRIAQNEKLMPKRSNCFGKAAS